MPGVSPFLLLSDDPLALQQEVLARCVAALREERAEHTAGTVLWIVPTHRAQKFWQRALMTAYGATVLGSPVMTFDGFAERILQAAGRPASAISSTVRRMLIRRITSEMVREGRLIHFEPVIATAGFLDIVEAFISELKRDEIWPEDFLAACRQIAKLSQRDRELGEIYRAYQEVLLAQNWYDSEGRFWLARSLLAEDKCRGLPQWSWIAIAGFTDFTLTQLEIIEQLSPRADALLLTLPHDVRGDRANVFARSTLSAVSLRHKFQGVQHRVVPAMKPETRERATLRTSLFGNPREMQPSPRCDRIELVGTTGGESELTSVALRIKNWLQSGVRPEEIIVGLRSVPEDGLRWRNGLRAAGLPVWCDTGSPLSEAGLVKFILNVLQAELEDWEFSRFMSVMGSSYLELPRKRLLRDCTVRSIGRVLRGLRLAQGRRQILASVHSAARRIQRVVNEVSAEAFNADDVDETQFRGLSTADYQPADRILGWYHGVTERLQKTHSLNGWTDVLATLVSELSPSSLTLHETNPDARVWELLQRMLRDAAAAEERHWGQPRRLSLAEFIEELRDLLVRERQKAEPELPGQIRILGFDQVRHFPVSHLVVVGLTEESFPRRRGDDCLFNDAERRQLADNGLPIRHASLHQQEEMLFFYQLMLSSRDRLLLTYPAVNHRGQPAFCSPYVTSLRTLWTEDALPIRHEGQLDPLPDPQRALTATDARLVAMQAALEGDAGWLRTLWEAPETRSMVSNLVAAVEMGRHRFHTAGFTNYEGRLELAENREAMANRFHQSRQFSATELESYASCPFRFWLQNVLDVAPLPEVEQGTDIMRRGTIVHDVLSHLVDELRPTPVLDRLQSRFYELVREKLQTEVAESDLQQALLRVEQSVMQEWGEQFTLQFEQYTQLVNESWSSDWSPATPELPFGDVPNVAVDQTSPPLQLGPEGSRVLIRGRIDRIDTGLVDGQPVYTVIDYKTGRRTSIKDEDVQNGTALQLVLYAIAARRLGFVPADALPFQIGYWCLKETGFHAGISSSRKKSLSAIDLATWQSLEQMVEETVPRLASSIREGDFIVDSLIPDCTSRCAYQTVCRVQQIRPLADSLNKRRADVNTPTAEEPKIS